MIEFIFILSQYIFINVKIISELFKILYKNTPFIISILIDNYIDESVLTLLDKRERGVKAMIYTRQII